MDTSQSAKHGCCSDSDSVSESRGDKQADASDVIDLSKVSSLTNTDSASSKQRKVQLRELKKKKRTEQDAKRLEVLYEMNDRQWRNADQSNFKLREILRLERKSLRSSDSSKQLLLENLKDKSKIHTYMAASSERLAHNDPFASGSIGSFGKSLGQELGIKQGFKERQQGGCKETVLDALASAYGSDTDDDQDPGP
ncbi:hypothetical protein FB645_000609 [Coemansia sp. IMI 203386]|nr:hypothetical protein FB645_000609 [Coemansia sp. IMI 203386]